VAQELRTYFEMNSPFRASLCNDGCASAFPAEACRQVAVFRALQLGDLLCAVPALRALRRGLPHARITLVGLPWAQRFAARFARYVDDFVAFPGAPELPEQRADVATLPAFFTRMRARRLDLAMQMHGDGTHTNAIVERFGARWNAGFRPADRPRADGRLFIVYPSAMHEVRRNLRLVGSIGMPAGDEAMEFPLTRTDFEELAASRAAEALADRPYICLHPGARNPAKRWPAERFARLGDALHARGYDVVLTGSSAERPITGAVASAMQAPCIDTASSISVGGLAALLAGAHLLVTNDTGVSHVAAGLRLPSVVVFFATDPAQWAPLDRTLHHAIYDPAGVDVDTVLRHALALLAAREPDAAAETNADAVDSRANASRYPRPSRISSSAGSST
jgi:ADP-heptose:LPS heptosyltransferase